METAHGEAKWVLPPSQPEGPLSPQLDVNEMTLQELVDWATAEGYGLDDVSVDFDGTSRHNIVVHVRHPTIPPSGSERP